MTPKHKKSENGFTLIEIMIVIIIMGILASYVAVKLTGQTEKARVTQARTQIESIKTALEMYHMDNGRYPSTDQGLQALVTEPTVGKLPRAWRKGGYLESYPKDPWGNEFFYLSPGEHGDYDISSFGNDGEPGGEDSDADINNWDAE